jgi:anaerobic ribonucleoside-triphosphate reductase activating protein
VAGPAVELEALVQRITAHAERGDIEGVTLSGGEPLQQADAVLSLLQRLRERTTLSLVLFSGYTLQEIRDLPKGTNILGLVDVLIDGRYEARERLGTGLRGSHNQRVHLLTERYSMADIAATPEAEIRIAPDGSFTMSGVAPVKIK